MTAERAGEALTRGPWLCWQAPRSSNGGRGCGGCPGAGVETGRASSGRARRLLGVGGRPWARPSSRRGEPPPPRRSSARASRPQGTKHPRHPHAVDWPARSRRRRRRRPRSRREAGALSGRRPRGGALRWTWRGARPGWRGRRGRCHPRRSGARSARDRRGPPTSKERSRLAPGG